MTDTATRCPTLDEDRLTERQREIYDRICSGPRGAVYGPLRVWIQSPELADRAQALGQFARYDSALRKDLSELAILVTARIWSSGFEWSHHAPVAASVGISGEVIDAIARAEWPPLEDDKHRAVFSVALEIHRDRRLSDETYAAAVDTLGLTGLVDLIGICGYYTLISMTINAFEVPDGLGPALPALSMRPEEMFRTAQTQDA